MRQILREAVRRSVSRRSRGAGAAAERARALEAEGRLREALEQWTQLNRLDPDPWIEEHLIELRCDDRLTEPTGRGIEPWPPTFDDPFPDVVGVPPEVDAAALTAELLGGGLRHHGCLLVRGLIPSHTTAVLREAIDRAFAGREAFSQGAARQETSPWYAPSEPWDRSTPDKARRSRRFSHSGNSSLHLCDSPRGCFEAIDALTHAGVVDVVSTYLGERVVLSSPKTMLRRVSPEATPSWHQDGSFMGVKSRVVNVWVALSDCGSGHDAPGIAILPRRLDESLHGEVSNGNIILSPAELDAARGDVEPVTPSFSAGDALLFDELMAHANGGGQPGLTRHRYALEAWMFAPTFMPADYLPMAL